MLSQDEAGKVVYASSFSKTVCPGIRVGYLVGPAALIKQVQGLATNTYISPNMVAQSIVNQFARSGRMESAVATVKDALRERRDVLVEALGEHLPEARFEPPSGGYFMWVELPEEVDVAELQTAAQERGVLFVKGTDFLLEGGANSLRLAFSGVTADQIPEGISRLADAVRSLGVTA
jgi:DNA-binding transcriptional MocR family regulator